jgi:hypothetical protein
LTKVQKAKAMMTKASKTKLKSFKKTLKKWKRELQWNIKAHHYGVLPKGSTKLRRSFGGKI